MVYSGLELRKVCATFMKKLLLSFIIVMVALSGISGSYYIPWELILDTYGEETTHTIRIVYNVVASVSLIAFIFIIRSITKVRKSDLEPERVYVENSNNYIE